MLNVKLHFPPSIFTSELVPIKTIQVFPGLSKKGFPFPSKNWIGFSESGVFQVI
jgi:hypothetical protein